MLVSYFGIYHRGKFALNVMTMKKMMIAACCVALLGYHASLAQAVQEAKEAKKEQKAEKKQEKAQKKLANMKDNDGLNGITSPKTKLAKAEKKQEKAVKKEMKSDAKAMKAKAKDKTKDAEKVVTKD